MNSFSDLDLTKQYTYSDYLTWKFQERVELFKGWVVKMTPAPNTRHQRIVKDMVLSIGNFLADKSCHLFPAPFDVRLPISKNKERIDTVVQPDIVIICDLSKLDEKGCNGAPDIVIEILSPGNTNKEMKDKLLLYQEAGVPEYWLVDPEHEFVLTYSLNEDGHYISSMPITSDDLLTSKHLPGFSLDLKKLFSPSF